MPFRFCPSCGSREIAFESGKLFRCPSCGFQYFHNVATAAGAILESDGRVVFVVRAMDPAAGLLALPGGFVDPGERAEDAVVRECREEIGWVPDSLEFLASFPNRYEYRGVIYNTCDFFFLARTNGLRAEDFSLDPREASGVRFVKPEDIDPDELAFDSTRRAIEVYLALQRMQ
jgi:NAD+ diphosphatase